MRAEAIAYVIRDGAIGCRNCGDTFERSVQPSGIVAACEDCNDSEYSLYSQEFTEQHSPLPWKWLPDEGQFIVDAKGNIVAEIPCQGCNPADGEFIVRHINQIVGLDFTEQDHYRSLLRELYETQRELPNRNFARDHSFEEWLQYRRQQ